MKIFLSKMLVFIEKDYFLGWNFIILGKMWMYQFELYYVWAASVEKSSKNYNVEWELIQWTWGLFDITEPLMYTRKIRLRYLSYRTKIGVVVGSVRTCLL
jgi:hypothetical protein